MIENSKVMVRVEYEQGGETKVCYGEIDETKLENFNGGGENFICMKNDELITWLDKESLLSIETLRVKKATCLKPRIIDYRSDINKDTGICP